MTELNDGLSIIRYAQIIADIANIMNSTEMSTHNEPVIHDAWNAQNSRNVRKNKTRINRKLYKLFRNVFPHITCTYSEFLDFVVIICNYCCGITQSDNPQIHNPQIHNPQIYNPHLVNPHFNFYDQFNSLEMVTNKKLFILYKAIEETCESLIYFLTNENIIARDCVVTYEMNGIVREFIRTHYNYERYDDEYKIMCGGNDDDDVNDFNNDDNNNVNNGVNNNVNNDFVFSDEE